MKSPLKIISFLIFVLLSFPIISLAGQFKVTRIYDGDAIKAEGYDITTKVRLVGIDAPEMSYGKRIPGKLGVGPNAVNLSPSALMCKLRSSFRRKPESSLFKLFWTLAFAGVTV